MKKNLNQSGKLTELAAFGIMVAMMAMPSAHAQSAPTSEMDKGGLQGGGGDTKTEGRIDEVRSDILQWINDGGAKNLKFDDGMTYQIYAPAMTQVLAKQAVVVSAISTVQENAQDNELNTSVAGQPKTCKSFISKKDGLPHILCNVERFAATGEADQYRLVHHEFAGLARMEKNVGAASDYTISNQITGSLEKVSVLKLVVKKTSPLERSANSVKIMNANSSKEWILIECVDDQCSSLKVTYPNYYSPGWGKMILDVQKMKEVLKQKLVLKMNCEDCPKVHLLNYYPYELTKNSLQGGWRDQKSISEQWGEGYYSMATMKAILLPVSLVLDTALLPYSSINSMILNRWDRVRHHEFKRIFESMENGKDFSLKKAQFEKVCQRLENGLSWVD